MGNGNKKWDDQRIGLQGRGQKLEVLYKTQKQNWEFSTQIWFSRTWWRCTHLDKGIEHTSSESSLAWLVTYILDTKNMGTTLLSLKAPINVNSRLCKLILEK